MAKIFSREIRLKNRPVGMVTEKDFELVEVEIPEIQDGQILVQNIYISVDPYMRGRMGERETYISPFELGKPMDGGCVGQVVRSRSENFQEGDYVLGDRGWRDFFVTDGQRLNPIDPEIMLTLPYFLALIVLGGLVGKAIAPASLGKPYDRSER